MYDFVLFDTYYVLGVHYSAELPCRGLNSKPGGQLSIIRS